MTDTPTADRALPQSDKLEDYRTDTFILPITRAIASRVVRPPGVEFSECHNDCVVIYLRKVDQLIDMNVHDRRKHTRGLPIGKWLWVRVLGDLRDIYKREWARIIDGPDVYSLFTTDRDFGNPALMSDTSDDRLAREESKERMWALYDYLAQPTTSGSTPQYAQVFKLLFIDGRTQVSIAKELGVTQPRISTIKRRIQALVYDYLVLGGSHDVSV